MSRRKLQPEEIELWRKVTEKAHRLHPERAQSALPKPKPKPIKPPHHRLPDFRLGEKAKENNTKHDVLPGLSDRLAAAPVRMDSKAFGKLKRGKLVPEGRIDLHGMTLAQAHPALNGFILRSHATGKRLVLVITGKGRSGRDDGPIPERRGILKHQVPQWLTMSPLAGVVLQVAEAHVSHGGTGAYYVYLRRS